MISGAGLCSMQGSTAKARLCGVVTCCIYIYIYQNS